MEPKHGFLDARKPRARKAALFYLPSIVDFVTSFVMEGKKTADTATSLDGHILSIL